MVWVHGVIRARFWSSDEETLCHLGAAKSKSLYNKASLGLPSLLVEDFPVGEGLMEEGDAGGRGGLRHEKMRTFAKPRYAAKAQLNAIVLDLGGMTTRAGWAGENLPSAVFPSVVGEYCDGDGRWHCAVDMESLSFAPPDLSVHGLEPEQEWVRQQLIESSLRKLGAAPSEHPLLLGERVDAPPRLREQTAELVFEAVGAPALCVARSAELVAISAARTTALILELGADTTNAAAVLEGTASLRSVHSSPITARQLVRTLARTLEARYGELWRACTQHRPIGSSGTGLSVPKIESGGDMDSGTTPSYSEAMLRLRSNGVAFEVFEAVGKVADAKALEAIDYALPDGRSISVAPDVQSLPSSYFEYKHSELPPAEPVAAPIWHLTLASVLATEAEWHKELLRNVVITGGASLLPGLPERLELELRQAMRNVSKLAGHEVPSVSSQAHRLGLLGAPHERLHATWLGGSILGSMGTHTQTWMSRTEYDDHGAALIHRKGMDTQEFW